VVLKMVASAFRNHVTDLLSKPTAMLSLRGESKFFFRDNNKTSDSQWTTSGASLSLSGVSSGLAHVECKKKTNWAGLSWCEPEDKCENDHAWFSSTCAPKVKVASNGWWRVDDPTLIGVVTENGLGGITAHIYCGPKRLFDDSSPGPTSTQSLEDCLTEGVKTNAKIRSSEPWKLFFPDEVVAVAVFGEVLTSSCKAETEKFSEQCSAAEADSQLDAHLLPHDKHSADGIYQGIRTGRGFPSGTPYQVVMRPEDILEASGLMERLLLSQD